MGIVFRQSVKTSIVTFTGAFLGAFIIWLSTNYIPKQQLGFTRNLTSQAILLSNFVFLGCGHVLLVYIHRFADSISKKKLLITLCLLVPLVTTTIATIAYFSLRSWIVHHFQPDDIPLMQQYFALLPLYTLLFSGMTMLELYLGTQMKVAISAFMREVVVRAINILIILLFAFSYISFGTLVVSTVLMYIVPVVIFIYLSCRTKGFGLSFRFRDLSIAEYKEMIHFSWYHFLLVITITIMSIMDILLIPFYDHKGLSAVAVYGVAVFIISFLQIPYKAMSTSTYAVLAQAFNNKDIAKAKDIFTRSSLNILIATTAISLLIWCNLGAVVGIIKNDYHDVIPVFSILLIGRFIDLSTGVNDTVLTITNYYKFNVYLSAVLVAVLYLLIRYLVPTYGITGAAWATTITLIIFNIAKYLFVWAKLDMQPYSGKTAVILISGACAFATGYFLPHFFSQLHHIYLHTFADVALRSSVIMIVYIAMLLWLKPSADLEEYIAQIKKNKRLF